MARTPAAALLPASPRARSNAVGARARFALVKSAPSSSHEHLSAALEIRYRLPLIAYFQRRTRSRAEAEDLTRATFLCLVQRTDTPAGETAGRFIFAIAADVLREHRYVSRTTTTEHPAIEQASNIAVQQAQTGVALPFAAPGSLLQRPSARIGAGRPGWRTGAVTILALVGSGMIWVATRGPQPQVYETRAGEQRTVVLPDSSKIMMDRNSRVSVMYSDRFRDLELSRGQAEFEVAKDPLRPFTVVAGKQRVVATGTLFNVDLLDGQLLVTLLRGEVAVADEIGARHARRPVMLRPSERLAMEQSSGLIRRTHVDASAVDAWRRGKIVFAQEPLGRAVARVNRYAARPITLTAWDYARAPISGVFDLGDSEGFARAVSARLPVRIEPHGVGLGFVSR